MPSEAINFDVHSDDDSELESGYGSECISLVGDWRSVPPVAWSAIHSRFSCQAFASEDKIDEEAEDDYEIKLRMLQELYDGIRELKADMKQ